MQELLNEYIVEQALIVIPVLLILGIFFKETPNFKDWLIPYALLILGIILTTSLIGFNADAIIQGVLVTGASILIHQGYKQVKNRE